MFARTRSRNAISFLFISRAATWSILSHNGTYQGAAFEMDGVDACVDDRDDAAALVLLLRLEGRPFN
jgi:hypothetical protein